MSKRLLLIVVSCILTAGVAFAGSSEEKLLAAGRVDEAVGKLQKRVQKSPEDAAGYHLLTRAHLLQERWDDAINAAERAVRLQPQNSDYHLWLGRAYGEKASRVNVFSAMRLAGRVRDSFERAVELNPDNVAARSDLAEFYIEAPGMLGGGRHKAAAQAERVDPLDPAAACWIRARMAEKDKDLPTAEKHYRCAIQASENSGTSWLDLAGFFHRTNRPAEMEAAIQQAISAENKRPEVLLGAARLLLGAERRLPFAIQLTRRYLDGDTVVDAPPFLAHYVLGSLLEQQGEKDAALAEYRAALALASQFEPARQALRRVSR